jgi:NADH:ubiquinone oxidoreductase 24 kD subunit
MSENPKVSERANGCSCKKNGINSIEEAKNYLPDELLKFIDLCMANSNSSSLLIAVLHKVQEHYGYLSVDAMDAVAYLMKIPTAKVSGVASFYHYFRLKPCGKFIIGICMGTACYVKGAQEVLDKFREELGIKEGETTKDAVFTLEISRCLGACALAPVVKIGDQIYSQVTADKVPFIIKQHLDSLKDNRK